MIINLVHLCYFLQDNLADYTENKQTASEHRILITQWVGHVWHEMSSTMKGTIVRGFEKCGISVPYNGSKDYLINIEGLPDYSVWQ